MPLSSSEEIMRLLARISAGTLGLAIVVQVFLFVWWMICTGRSERMQKDKDKRIRDSRIIVEQQCKRIEDIGGITCYIIFTSFISMFSIAVVWFCIFLFNLVMQAHD